LPEITVNHHKRLGGMADRRHAAYGEAGRGADECGVGTADLLTEEVTQLRFVHPIDARRDDEHRAAIGGLENQRFGDLGDGAAKGSRGILGCPRAHLEFQHGEAGPERRLDEERARSGGGPQAARSAALSSLFSPRRENFSSTPSISVTAVASSMRRTAEISRAMRSSAAS